ncbi:MAG: glycosyltransferase family 4 protein [Candidatus Sumerlaeaceae bacterium]
MHRQWGGQPNRVLMTSRGLRDLGHEVVVSGPRDCVLVQRAKEAGLRTFDDLELRSGFRPLSIWRDVASMREHLLAERYDIVDTHGSQDTWRVHYALQFMKPEDRPAFVRSRHNIFPVSGNPLNKWLYAKIDHVIVISPQVIPQMAAVVGPERCTSIYSAPDLSRFDLSAQDATAQRKEVRGELGLDESARVVGVVGRLAPEKGHRYLVEASRQIAREVPDVQFVFVGQGRTRAELEQQIAALPGDLPKRFHVLGFREDVPRLLRGFDLFVLPPTEGESLGTSILEAFAADLPVVATDVGGVSESVIDGRTGRLVPPANSAALAQAIIEMLNNPAAATAMAQNGKARVHEIFTPEAIARQTEAVYKKVLVVYR